MNYASVVFAGFAGVSIFWYFIYARKHFKGPPISEEARAATEFMTGTAVDAEKSLEGVKKLPE